MKRALTLLIFVLSFAVWASVPSRVLKPAPASSYTEAERLVDEGSYRLALERYQKVDVDRLEGEEERWVLFRLADLQWRAAPEDADDTPLQQAERALQKMLVDEDGNPIDDRVRPEILESLGDLNWSARRRNFGGAWQFYSQALDWWGGSRDLDVASERYLAIVRKASTAPDDTWNPRGYWSTSIPLEVLENCVRIAKSPSDVGWSNYLLGLNLSNRSDADSIERARETWEAALETKARSDWRDDALFFYGQWLSRIGRLEWDENGGFRASPDWERAVEVFRTLLAEYPKGVSRWRDQAEAQLKSITEPSLGIAVSNVFLPDSKIEFGLSWRNVASVDFTLTSVDLTTAIRFEGRRNASEWLDAIDATSGREVIRWSKTLDRRDRYEPGQDQIPIAQNLSPGAWLLEASSGSTKTRDLILVTDLAVVTRVSGTSVLAWTVDARSGVPRSDAAIRMWHQYYRDGSYRVTTQTARSDADGLVDIPFEQGGSGQAFLVAKWKDRQAFVPFWGNHSSQSSSDQWKIYAFTDRPAYRPDETVQWKITSRVSSAAGYRVPANDRLHFQIRDPRGTEVKAGDLQLNSFGSAWATLDLDASMPLGIYTINFETIDPRRSVGNAQLFRLEEYKLPEFRVSVTTEDADGKPRLFRLGDEIEARVEASYYFGGPVANATAAVVVYQQPYYRWWLPERTYPWFFEGRQPSPGWYGGGQEIKRATLTTDAEGRATISFDTPRGGNQDYEYRIEARVTDTSRREIVGESRIRVTKAPFAAEARPQHYLFRPGDKVDVTFRAVDANDQPAMATGTVRITRERWREIWLDPEGRRVTGDALEAIKARIGIFPPPQEPEHHPWRLIERGYDKEEVRTDSFTTDDEGRAVVSYTPDREGYYRFEFTSRPRDLDKPRPRDIVKAETTAWVATNASTRIGYHREGGIEIILDEESVRAGRNVPVMLVAPTGGRNVLFTVETDRILSRQLVRMNGNVRLIDLPVGDQHIPNVFLASTMVTDLQLFQDTKELVVPPVEKFLEIEVSSDREEYQPRDKGRFDVRVTDVDGKPVQGEIALGIADESVYTIGEDLAGDPRQFFFGEKRYHNVRLDSSFNYRQYGKLVEQDGKLIDERYARNEGKEEGGRYRADEQLAVGGVAGAAPQPAPMAEAITVAAESPAMRQVAAKSMAMDSVAEANAPMEGPTGGEVVVRSDFRSTVFWQPDIMTDTNGRATVDVTFPDSLTTWRATARGATKASQFGIASSSVRTKKPLIARLQAPRFFVVGDETVVSAVINNNTDRRLTATPSIDVAGLDLVGLFVDGIKTRRDSGPLSINAGGEARIDWVVSAREPGEARLRVAARAGELSDAMEKSFRVEDHGIDVLVATGGKVRGSEATLSLRIPAERGVESTTMTVQVTPSIAVTMLDAIPYLIDYPYGCTEQTMSRFLPTVIVAKTLSDLGVPRETVASRLFGGIEQATADKTHSRAKQDLAKMDEMIRAGLVRLYDFQHDDGGWGWWKEGSSDRFMSAYVVWGLSLARDSGVDIRRNALDRGVAYLVRELVQEEDNPERQAWMLHAISAARRSTPSELERKAFENSWAKRDSLSAYGVSLLALSAHQYGLTDRAQTLVRNLENGAVIDRTPDKSILVKGSGSGSDTVMATAHWGSAGRWWRWYDGPVESTSFALRALSAIDPSHRLIEPTMNWLVKNRRGAQWSNTRDTAIAVLALNEYLKSSRELGTAMEYEVVVNGRAIAKRTIERGDAVGAPSRLEVPRDLISDGVNEIIVRRTRGEGALYVSAEARFFSREEPVKAAGNELFVKREYLRLEPHPTLLKGFIYDKVPLRDGGSVQSGDRIEVVVTLEAKNDYEYLLIEDLKPAGFEAIDVQSGMSLVAHRLRAPEVEKRHGESTSITGKPMIAPRDPGYIDSRAVYRELRDRKVAMFIDQLGQGVWEIRYTLRAEVPGSFHALPVIGQAMYVPEIRGNGEEVRVTVEE